VIIGVPRETRPGERRVALTPGNVKVWTDKGADVLIEADAGRAAGFPDNSYEQAGARLLKDRAALFAEANVLVQVQSFGANTVSADQDLELLRPGQLIAGMMDPLGNPGVARQLAARRVTAIAMELVPRISRAQSMDALSSMASLAGYKAVLLGASLSPRIMPMMMTAAGTLQPMRVLVMGAGVAGLQACATAKRLGAVVEAYDVRPAARDQIISVGARPVELALEADNTEDKGGYAKQQSEDFLRRQREAMARVLAEQNLVITTAAIPGARSPVLVTADMVATMRPGSVIIDLAAERGGNCELTRLGKTVNVDGITIYGPDNLAATLPTHASQMYGKNIEVMLGFVFDGEGRLTLNFQDEVISETVICHQGEVIHERLRHLLGLPPLATAEEQATPPPVTETHAGEKR